MQLTSSLEEPRYYAHWLGKHRLTEGVHALEAESGAGWLIDKIVTNTLDKPALRDEHHVVWDLRVAARKGVLMARSGDDEVLYVERGIGTDFPHASATIRVMHNVLLLPTEY